MKQLSLLIGIGFVVAAAAPLSAQRGTSVRDSVRKAIAAAIPVDARPRTEAELAIGLPDLTEQSTTFQETIINASVPGLERFGIEASAAWRDRSMRPGAPTASR